MTWNSLRLDDIVTNELRAWEALHVFIYETDLVTHDYIRPHGLLSLILPLLHVGVIGALSHSKHTSQATSDNRRDSVMKWICIVEMGWNALVFFGPITKRKQVFCIYLIEDIDGSFEVIWVTNV